MTLLISSANHAYLRAIAWKAIDAPWPRTAGARVSEFHSAADTIEGCRSAIEQDLRRSHPPTAIFAATFYATIGAVKAINALDLAFT